MFSLRAPGRTVSPLRLGSLALGRGHILLHQTGSQGKMSASWSPGGATSLSKPEDRKDRMVSPSSDFRVGLFLPLEPRAVPCPSETGLPVSPEPS